MKNLDFSRFSEKFIDDAHHLLNELEGKILELEQDPENPGLIESVFRAMHTLKGIGAMFGFDVISEYTHHLETIFDKIREKAFTVNHDIIEITFHSVDHIRNLLNDKNLLNPEISAKHALLLNRLEEISDSAPRKPQESILPRMLRNGQSSWYIQFICTEEIVKRAINIEYIFQDLSKLGTYTIFNHSDAYNSQLGQQEEMWGVILTTSSGYAEIEEVFMFIPENVKIIRLEDPLPLPERGLSGTISEIVTGYSDVSETLVQTDVNNVPDTVVKTGKIPRISVGADKLDKLMYLVSELFTTRSELIMATRGADMQRIKLAVEKVDKLSAQFRKNALNIRLVPLRELTLKFKRLVRDLSRQLSKDIIFDVKGDETELDKNLVDSLADPLMHLIRNCIDHGIESARDRIECGKPENGVIRFLAYQSGNHIFIEISDDGKGIDPEVIRQKAIEKGLISNTAHYSEHELLQLIFLPGFSTAQNLTQVSGRGVGMDVVKRSVADLRGSIDLETKKGKGTTFILKLQQTISIVDTLLVKTGDSHFTIVLEEVEVCGLESHQKLAETHNSQVVVSGELIPYISLRDSFCIAGSAPETERIIVVRRQDRRYAIVADQIIGQYQAVIKPLDSVLKTKEYISGASIMGDGNIAFMLDTHKLSQYKTQ